MKANKSNKNIIKILKGKNAFIAIMLIFPLLLFVVFWIVPNIIGMYLPFTRFRMLADGGRVMEWVGLTNFKDYFKQMFGMRGSEVWIATRNSIIIYLVSLVIQMPLYVLFSYYIYKGYLGSKTMRLIILIPSTVAGFSMVILFKYFIGFNGPLSLIFGESYKSPLFSNNDALAFCVLIFYSTWTSFSTFLIIFPNAMMGISPDVVESSRIDGVSGMFTDLRYIVIPLIWPTLSTFLINGFKSIMSNTNNLDTFYGSGAAPKNLHTIATLINRLLAQGGDFAWGFSAAGSLILMFILVPAAWLFKKLLDRMDPTRDAY